MMLSFPSYASFLPMFSLLIFFHALSFSCNGFYLHTKMNLIIFLVFQIILYLTRDIVYCLLIYVFFPSATPFHGSVVLPSFLCLLPSFPLWRGNLYSSYFTHSSYPPKVLDCAGKSRSTQMPFVNTDRSTTRHQIHVSTKMSVSVMYLTTAKNNGTLPCVLRQNQLDYSCIHLYSLSSFINTQHAFSTYFFINLFFIVIIINRSSLIPPPLHQHVLVTASP